MHDICSCLEYKEKWGAYFAGNLLNMGVWSTSMVEGTYWRIKDTMQITGSLLKTVKAINAVIQKTVIQLAHYMLWIFNYS